MLEATLYRDQFATAAMRAVWSERATLGAWLQTEAAIAACQADLGLVPRALAEALAALAPDAIDRARFNADMDLVGRPIVGLLAQVREILGPDLAAHLHRGATTQDIMDTGLALQMAAGRDLLLAQVDGVLGLIDGLAAAHGATPMVGRTNGQHALPITFGAKLAVWSAELRRRRETLETAAQRGLMVQFGGPVGDLRAFDGDTGPRLKRAIAERLGLGLCEPHWQNARDGVAEVVGALGLLCGSLDKIARNVNALSSSDIGELHETPGPGKGASSSMGHKRNQRCSEFAEAVGRLGRQRAQDIHEAARHDHERSGGAWIAEWVIVPQVFLLASGALMWTERLFGQLEVDAGRMAANLAGCLEA
ncbi:MAG: hypothetical protein KDE22_02710 [Rhodobacterales bacterium]|nr:hypothetical protein [Rhodobacterales bacterium]